MRQHRQRWMWFDETQDGLRDDTELVVDCFAGGGGASTGLARGIGRPVDVAINHDKAAIAMHLANHPDTHHWCENLWDVAPEDVTGGRPIGAAWFSPDCTHHSRAKGNKPKEARVRALAWVVLRWAARVRPRVIFLENVEEFLTWGPLDSDGHVIEASKGETFRAFTGALECGVERESSAIAEMREYLGDDVDRFDLLNGLGYTVEWRTLVASDYGAPTTRKRLFLVARCDGHPIVWPEPSHGSPKEIARQIKRNGACRLKTWRTAAEIIDWSIPCPSIFLSRAEARAQGLNVQRPLREKTLRRIAEGIRRYVIEHHSPFIVRTEHGGNHFRGQGLDRPLSTITQKLGYAVADPVLAPVIATYYGPKGDDGHRGRMLNEPLPTQPTENRFALVAPTLVQTGYGERERQAPRCLDLHRPIGTVVAAGGKHALVSAFIAKHFGGVTGIEAIRPFPTITTIGTQNQLVAATLVKNNHGQKQWFDLREPLRTIVSQGTHHAVVQSRLEHVRAFLFRYYGSGGQWNRVDAPAPTITVKERLALGIVLVSGEPYQIVDIGMRMLTPRELFRAQGFPDSYVIDTGINGKPASKADQVGRCGNSVCPDVVAAVVRSNFAPRKVAELTAA